MLRFKLFLVFFAATSIAALGQPQAPAQPAAAPELGKVSFPISCKAEVRPAFERGVALLHSFQYAAAQKAFSDVALADPKCAMAYWGLAMTTYHPLWEGANSKALAGGRNYLDKGQKIGGADQREHEYMNALAFIFSNKSSSDRLTGYSHALAELGRHYPEDGEAQAFYALSLLALPETGDGLATRRQAIQILNRLWKAQPEHPGAAHYLIHAADTPELAAEGLAAARQYAKIAPDSSHALHMPSHIFVRLGLWQESVDSNVAAATAAGDATQHHLGEAHYQFHAMDFLDYSYLQMGQEGKARQVVEELGKVPGASEEVIRNVRVNLVTRNMLELHRWKEALMLAPEGNAWDQQMIYSTRAIAAARLGNVKAAEENLKGLKKAAKQDRQAGEHPDHIRRDEAEAWLAFAKGKHEKALKIMRAAADRQDKNDPGSFVVPAREMLADMLLDLHQGGNALSEYESVLKLAPNRFNALYGAAAAAEMAGDPAKAKTYYAKLRENCPAQADREELQHAKPAAAGQ
jgi:hypothetical protein